MYQVWNIKKQVSLTFDFDCIFFLTRVKVKETNKHTLSYSRFRWVVVITIIISPGQKHTSSDAFSLHHHHITTTMFPLNHSPLILKNLCCRPCRTTTGPTNMLLPVRNVSTGAVADIVHCHLHLCNCIDQIPSFFISVYKWWSWWWW